MHDRRVAVVVVSLCIVVGVLVAAPRTGSASAGGSGPGGSYRHPVDAPVVSGFDLPDGPYGRGNRGVDYATAPGTTVRAAGDGEVVFAGSVAGSLHVTVLHPDGLRTSYSYLASTEVRRGQAISQGDPLGTTAALLHVGVRDGTDQYLDPARLFDGTLHSTVRLVPGVEEGALALEARERRSFLALAASVAQVVLPGASGAPSRVRVLAHYAMELQPIVRAQHLAAGYRRWHDQQQDCTAPSAAPSRPPGRRILVLVAGFGSTSVAAGVDKVDAEALGYAASDVVRFSYRGGRVPSDGLAPALAALPATDYGAGDSQQRLVDAADGLRALLEEIATVEPGVPIDVVAHSQGGVVSRLAVLRADASGSLPSSVDTLVTISSPHGGADLATALHGVAAVSGADQSLAVLQGALGLQLDANSPAVADLSEVSPLTDDLRGRGVPDGIDFVSIGARGDLVVASPRTVVSGEASVIVDVAGLHAHDQVSGSAAVTREIALAVAGAPPTCSSFLDATLDLGVGEAISWATDQLGASGLVLAAPLP